MPLAVPLRAVDSLDYFRMKAVFAAIAVLGGALQLATPPPDLSRHFVDIQGTFVLLNDMTGEYIRYNDERAAEQFPPCSTFKIPNTAILLESAVAPDPDYVVKYDPTLKESNSDWARDHTMRSAFRFSVLWYYQTLARRAGMPLESRFVRQFNYGNMDTRGGGLDKTGLPFWVDGSLRISANEQVAFLKRLYEGRLGLSERTMRLTKDIMLTEMTPTWTLSAKTGACQPAGEDTANWYIGYVEKREGVYYFALEMGDKDFGRAFSERVSKTREILTDLGVLR
jgi:beta-lactamase class D